MTRIRCLLMLATALAALPGCGTWGIAPPVVTPDLPLVQTSVERARLDHESGELILELGPVDLPAGAGHAAHTAAGASADGGQQEHHAHGGADNQDAAASAQGKAGQPEPVLVIVPFSGWLHGYKVELVDAAGRKVPREVLHHVNLMAPERRELFSPIMQRIAAAGEETAPVRLPGVVGYPVTEGLRLLLTAMYHNPTGEEWEGVQLRLRLPYTRKGSRRPILPVFPFYMDVMPPAGVHAYDLPSGRSEQSWEGAPAVAGRILGVGGHLHRYGVALRLEDVTAGKVLWEGRPRDGLAGEPARVPPGMFWWRLGVRVRPDHRYRLTAVYDNPGEPVPAGAMGALGGIILPDAGQGWPPVDPRHPTYGKDVATVLGLDEDTPETGAPQPHEHGLHR